MPKLVSLFNNYQPRFHAVPPPPLTAVKVAMIPIPIPSSASGLRSTSLPYAKHSDRVETEPEYKQPSASESFPMRPGAMKLAANPAAAVLPTLSAFAGPRAALQQSESFPMRPGAAKLATNIVEQNTSKSAPYEPWLTMQESSAEFPLRPHATNAAFEPASSGPIHSTSNLYDWPSESADAYCLDAFQDARSGSDFELSSNAMYLALMEESNSSSTSLMSRPTNPVCYALELSQQSALSSPLDYPFASTSSHLRSIPHPGLAYEEESSSLSLLPYMRAETRSSLLPYSAPSTQSTQDARSTSSLPTSRTTHSITVETITMPSVHDIVSNSAPVSFVPGDSTSQPEYADIILRACEEGNVNVHVILDCIPVWQSDAEAASPLCSQIPIPIHSIPYPFPAPRPPIHTPDLTLDHGSSYERALSRTSTLSTPLTTPFPSNLHSFSSSLPLSPSPIHFIPSLTVEVQEVTSAISSPNLECQSVQPFTSNLCSGHFLLHPCQHLSPLTVMLKRLRTQTRVAFSRLVSPFRVS